MDSGTIAKAEHGGDVLVVYYVHKRSTDLEIFWEEFIWAEIKILR